jgi:hypothetical protein
MASYLVSSDPQVVVRHPNGDVARNVLSYFPGRAIYSRVIREGGSQEWELIEQAAGQREGAGVMDIELTFDISERDRRSRALDSLAINRESYQRTQAD